MMRRGHRSFCHRHPACPMTDSQSRRSRKRPGGADRALQHGKIVGTSKRSSERARESRVWRQGQTIWWWAMVPHHVTQRPRLCSAIGMLWLDPTSIDQYGHTVIVQYAPANTALARRSFPASRDATSLLVTSGAIAMAVRALDALRTPDQLARVPARRSPACPPAHPMSYM